MKIVKIEGTYASDVNRVNYVKKILMSNNNSVIMGREITKQKVSFLIKEGLETTDRC